jgi:tRNA U38,U39,U40 pseudouridine synthase TruA
MQALNSVLPRDIRVLGWADVPERFSARFSATLRTYRYYFVRRDLDLAAMRAAGRALAGRHDFRNVCKIDIANTQNFVRDILSVRIVAADVAPSQAVAAVAGAAGAGEGGYNSHRVAAAAGHTSSMGSAEADDGKGDSAAESPLSIYYIEVVGRAFLWHQIRCVAALLFLVGRGAESPATVAALLDVSTVRARPQYAMAGEAPLILHHCGFGEEDVAASESHDAGAGGGADEDEADLAEEVGVGGGGFDDVSSSVSAAAGAAAQPLERRVRFLRSHPPLHSSWQHSAAALRRLTTDLEAQWSEAAVRAAMLRGLLDRAYAGRLPRSAVEETIAAKAAAAGGSGRGGDARGAAAISAAVAANAEPAESSSGSALPSAADDETMSWAAAVDAFGGRAAQRAGLEVPLLSPADAEYLVLPPAGGEGGADARPATRRGRHLPLLQRATGKGVEQRWQELSDAQRAEIAQQHPVNAPRLAAAAAAAAGAAALEATTADSMATATSNLGKE